LERILKGKVLIKGKGYGFHEWFGRG